MLLVKQNYDGDCQHHKEPPAPHDQGWILRFRTRNWDDVSSEAKDLVQKLFTVDPKRRITAAEACENPWFSIARGNLAEHDLSANLEQLKMFNAQRKFRAAIRSVLSARRVVRDLGLMFLKRAFFIRASEDQTSIGADQGMLVVKYPHKTLPVCMRATVAKG
eukprot:g15637.t1